MRIGNVDYGRSKISTNDGVSVSKSETSELVPRLRSGIVLPDDDLMAKLVE